MKKIIFLVILAVSIVKIALPEPTEVSNVQKGIIKIVLNNHGH